MADPKTPESTAESNEGGPCVDRPPVAEAATSPDNFDPDDDDDEDED